MNFTANDVIMHTDCCGRFSHSRNLSKATIQPMFLFCLVLAKYLFFFTALDLIPLLK